MFTATRDGIILGTEVRAGQTVDINTFLCNRDPTVFKNPDEFDIRRYVVSSDALAENPDAVTEAPQMGFSYGAHQCLGKNLAFLEARCAIANMLAKFDFSIPSDYLVGYEFDKHMIPHPNGDAPMIVRRRK